MGKEEVKLIFIPRWQAGNIENLNECTKKQKPNCQLINEFSRVVGYKINIQYSVLVLYTSNECFEVKLGNSFFYNRIKNIKIFGNKFNKRSVILIYQQLQNIVEIN